MAQPSAGASHGLGLSGLRLTVHYRVQAIGRAAERMASLLCIDQTVEASDEVIPDGPIRRELIGQIASLDPIDDHSTEIRITFPLELAGRTAAQCLHLLFGTSSLKPGIRVTGLDLPPDAPVPWPGPRFGRNGLRSLLNVASRPLVCAVLKPLGLPPKDLAALAHRFALGGVDFIKDDQGMTDQTFCPFAERVTACATAIAEANHATGGACRYVAHVSGTVDEVRARAAIAKQAGSGGLLICPGLTGYDAMRELAAEDAIALPIFSHPAYVGTYALHHGQGLAPSVLYGLLPRLMGADVSIYPTWGSEFGLDKADCTAIMQATGNDELSLASTFPTAAGRIGYQHIAEVCKLYGRDVVFILGSRMQRDPEGIVRTCRRFIETLERSGTLPC